MPELPEVETVRKKLLTKLKNKKIKSVNIIYPNIFFGQDIEKIKENIKNQTINDIKRKGKWLIFELDDYYLLSHLRMEGKYLYRNIGEKIEKHEHVIFNINDEFELRYKDTRKFGRMYLVDKTKINESPLKDVGPDPWDEKLTINYLKEKYNNKKIPIKTALLDQSIIAGIGNIYADEILFLSKIHPLRKCGSLNNKELESIIENTKKVLEKAIEEGGTTIRSYTSEEGVTGLFQNELYVHQREKEECRICKTIIKKIRVGQRGTYYCEKCQINKDNN